MTLDRPFDELSKRRHDPGPFRVFHLPQQVGSLRQYVRRANDAAPLRQKIDEDPVVARLVFGQTPVPLDELRIGSPHDQ